MQDIAILRTLASYPYVVFSPSLPVHNIMPPCDEMSANPFSAVFDQSHLPYGTSPGTRLSDRARAVLGTMRGPPRRTPHELAHAVEMGLWSMRSCRPVWKYNVLVSSLSMDSEVVLPNN